MRNTEDEKSDQAELHQRFADRLCSDEMPALEGPWFAVLGAELKLSPLDANALAKAFHQREPPALFRALSNAQAKTPPHSESEQAWAHDLTLFCAMRCFNLGRWTKHGAATTPGAVAYTVATCSVLIAAIGVSGLQGRVFRINQDEKPANVCQIGGTPSVDVKGWVLGQAYDQLVPDRPRKDPQCVSPDELGRLEDYFRRHRENGEFAGIFVNLTGLSSEALRTVAPELADAIREVAMLGAADHAPDLLTDKIGDYTLNGLLARLRSILTVLSRPQTLGVSRDNDYEWDVFISHASADKAAFVLPLIAALKERNVRVWWDAEALTMGDKLMTQINTGLSRARFGAVVLSPTFLGRGWPLAELDALFSMELTRQKKRILPIAKDLTRDQLCEKLPLLGGRIFADAESGSHKVADEIIKALNADRRSSSA